MQIELVFFPDNLTIGIFFRAFLPPHCSRCSSLPTPVEGLITLISVSATYPATGFNNLFSLVIYTSLYRIVLLSQLKHQNSSQLYLYQLCRSTLVRCFKMPKKTHIIIILNSFPRRNNPMIFFFLNDEQLHFAFILKPHKVGALKKDKLQPFCLVVCSCYNHNMKTHCTSSHYSAQVVAQKIAETLHYSGTAHSS